MASSNDNLSIALPERKGLLAFLASHPAGFWFIFWGEFAERCSYYGMRAILAVYIADQLQFGKGPGGRYYYFFLSACYLLPLIGGWIADNYLGKFNTIVSFSLPYILGHVVLGFENSTCLFIALVLLAMGAGVIKPNISTLMGLTYDQQRPGQELLRTQAFSMFYMAINIGAGISQLAIPPIKDTYGYQIAFLFPAVLMALSFLAFASGKRFYAVEKIERRKFTPEDFRDMWRVIRKVGPVFLTVVFFWAIFDQSSGTWIYFGNDYQDTLWLPLLGTFTAERLQSFNPWFIVIFLPLVTYLFTTLAKKGIQVKMTTKLMLGFFLTAVCMLIMSVPAYTGWRSLWWQGLAYLILTLAEILISVTGLEMAFVVAPQRMKGFVTALWLLTVFLANFALNAPLADVYPNMHPGDYFVMLAGMMGVVMLIFVFVARDYHRLAAAEQAAASSSEPPVSLRPQPLGDASSEAVYDKTAREGITTNKNSP